MKLESSFCRILWTSRPPAFLPMIPLPPLREIFRPLLLRSEAERHAVDACLGCSVLRVHGEQPRLFPFGGVLDPATVIIDGRRGPLDLKKERKVA